MYHRRALLLISWIALLSTPLSAASPGGGAPAGGGGTAGGGGNAGGPGGGSLQGLSYPQVAWKTDLTKLPSTKHRRVLCYKLASADSLAQPFVLQPSDKDSVARFQSKCEQVSDKKPLLMNEILVIGIDVPQDLPTGALRLLNLNVTNAQGAPLNPNPVRPSLSAAPAAAAAEEVEAVRTAPAVPAVYFLTWPTSLQGDTVPTVSVNTIYTPPLPGRLWQPKTLYPTGSVVTFDGNNGHYYTAVQGGVSGPVSPSPILVPPNTVADGAVVLSWQDSVAKAGTSPAPPVWKPNTSYPVGSQVSSGPGSTDVYTAVTPGVSGIVTPVFPVGGTKIVQDNDGKPLQWVDSGASLPAGAVARQWLPTTPYLLGDIVAPGNGHYYTAVHSGLSGGMFPTFTFTSATAFPDHSDASGESSLHWQDSGFSAPASVAAGQPADEVVNLLTLALPQAHSLYYYNLASGIVGSSIRDTSFVFNGNKIQKIDGSLTVDPLLMFTFYWHPIDAESAWHKEELWSLPGLSLGLSLTSPGSTFYLGFSTEIRRNVQLVYGLTVAKTTRLGPQPATAGTSPATVQAYTEGAFVGLTFNVSGFIQGLFGGGGAGKSSS